MLFTSEKYFILNSRLTVYDLKKKLKYADLFAESIRGRDPTLRTFYLQGRVMQLSTLI